MGGPSVLIVSVPDALTAGVSLFATRRVTQGFGSGRKLEDLIVVANPLFTFLSSAFHGVRLKAG
jgi:hypothetical protein